MKKKLHDLHIASAWHILWRASEPLTLLSILLSLLQGVLPLLLLYLMKWIVDAIPGVATEGDAASAFQEVLYYILLAGGVFLAQTLVANLFQLLKTYLGQKATDLVYSDFHKKAVGLDVSFYENAKYQDIMFRARSEIAYRPTRIVHDFMQISQSAVSLVLIAGLLFVFHWSIVIILFVATLPGILVRLRYAGIFFKWQHRQTPTERRADYFNWIMTTPRFAKELRVYQLGNYFNKQFKKLRHRLRTEKWNIAKKRSLVESIAQTGTALAVFGSYSFIAYQAAYKNISLGEAVMFFMAFQRGLQYFKDLLHAFAAFYEDNLFLSNLHTFLNLKSRIKKENSIAENRLRTAKFDIEFRDVYFRYPDTQRWVLKNLNFTVKADETIAIVGENGAGKTTLIKLLCRLYDCTNGSIRLNGENIENYQVQQLYAVFSVLFQDFAAYNLSVIDNIWFGNISKAANHSAIEKAARNAGAKNFIDKLIDSYETILGRFFEKGEEISTGEWQKIALARAFYKDAPIIILDEPSGAMDPKSEYEVFRRIKQLTKNKTAIIISHRLSTIRDADRIFVIDSHTIAEEGTHQQLMQKNGIYARLFRRQAGGYTLYD